LASDYGLARIDSAQTSTVHGSTIHPTTYLGYSPGVGLANSADGSVYVNTYQGIEKLDPATGAVLAGPCGNAQGNGYGITLDPVSHNLVYAAEDGDFWWISPDFTQGGRFSTQLLYAFGGMAFEPTGNYLFITDYFSDLTILDRNGAVVRQIALTSGQGAQGVAFHTASPQFVVTNNADGTLTRIDFPAGVSGPDYSQPPSGQSTLASGGSYGTFLSVGGDGCLYVPQDSTRYQDGTVELYAGSLVRICDATGGGFSPSAHFQGVGSPQRLDEGAGNWSSEGIGLITLLLAIAVFLRRSPWTWGG
jgi:hypothetical protein